MHSDFKSFASCCPRGYRPRNITRPPGAEQLEYAQQYLVCAIDQTARCDADFTLRAKQMLPCLYTEMFAPGIQTGPKSTRGKGKKIGSGRQRHHWRPPTLFHARIYQRARGAHRDAFRVAIRSLR